MVPRVALAASLLVAACGGAAAQPDSNAAAKKPAAGGAKGQPQGFQTFRDEIYGFQVDIFGKTSRAPTQVQKGPKASVAAYTASATSDERGQLVNVQVLSFPGGKTSDDAHCKRLLPAIFTETAQERLNCGPVSNVQLLEHAPGVFSITGDLEACDQNAALKTTLHVACDERTDGEVLAISLVGMGSDQKDPPNRWFLCSLKLKGDVITCPWGQGDSKQPPPSPPEK